MSDIRGTLRITLKSDLCAGSGDGFSSGIDTDVCYDKHGLPTIPGRRIKGCLREAAQLMCCEGIDRAFGVSGQRRSGCLRVDDASLPKADQVIVPGDAQATLDRYTVIRAKTALDKTTGSAKPGSLRFERVVRHWLPNLDGGFSETVFLARVRTSEGSKELVETAARALRNMGLGRNRGYGAVSCAIEWDKETIKPTAPVMHVTRFDEGGRAMAAISYRIRLDAPVMLPRDNSTRSSDCIPGTSVLGCFASHLRNSPRFDELFLSGNVRFSPLYPVDARGIRAIPAPAFVVKAKGGELDGHHLLATAVPEGQAVKPLKSGFVGSDWLPVSVQTETVYHHSRVGEGTLYTQRCLSAGQEFAGFVECPDVYVDEIRSVLESGEVSFGRSKTAQYARCSVLPNDEDHSARDGMTEIAPGHTIVAVLESDVLLFDDSASCATSFDALVEALRSELGPWAGPVDVETSCGGPFVTSVRQRTISGYNAHRNQKRAHVRAFEAGSCVAFLVPDNAEPTSTPSLHLLGERKAEGFGRVLLIDLSSIEVNPSVEPGGSTSHGTSTSATDNTAELARQNMLELADGMRKKLTSLNPSFVGRLALMVREAGSVEELNARIDSIKNTDKKNAARDLVNKVEQSLPDDRTWALEKECLDLVLDLAKYFSKQALTSTLAPEGREA